ncbi:hypothetical protein GDO78_015753 [Eleutherodactylus coqui]|uniref:Uncharacterized protein n=1 Tax=Eleutherodactylus coqui TaxID=57060 RepID=A0A8J6E3W4_ELECQ|nr:hypothetical protein GDO78_015753 [Eleutherodactylus coqui]
MARNELSQHENDMPAVECEAGTGNDASYQTCSDWQWIGVCNNRRFIWIDLPL